MTVMEKARSSAVCIDNGMKIRHDGWLKQDRYIWLCCRMSGSEVAKRKKRCLIFVQQRAGPCRLRMAAACGSRQKRRVHSMHAARTACWSNLDLHATTRKEKDGVWVGVLASELYMGPGPVPADESRPHRLIVSRGVNKHGQGPSLSGPSQSQEHAICE